MRGRPSRSIASAQDGLRYKPLNRRRGLPIPAGIVGLALFAVVAVFMLTVGGRLLGGIVAEVGKVVGEAVNRVASEAPATVAPSGVALDTPILDSPPGNGYTSQPAQVLAGSVPKAVVGKSNYLVRVYLMGAKAVRTKVAEIQVGATTRFRTDAITLKEGPNTFIAVLVSPSGEGGASPPVIYTLDTRAPALTITSPGANVLVKGTSVSVAGRSENGVTISIHNRQFPGGAPASVVVGESGTFRVSVKLVVGDNSVDVIATDQADNSTTVNIQIKRDYGQLAAHLTASPTKINSNKVVVLTLTVHATASNGAPLTNATAYFMVNVSGLGEIDSGPIKTDAKGMATFTTTIAGAVKGSGWASVLVTSDLGDQVKGTTILNAY